MAAQELTLSENVDCVEFCPHSRETLAVTTYQLDEATQIREGKVYVFTSSSSIQGKLEQVTFCNTGGVFDVAWRKQSGNNLLVAACADGNLKVLQYDKPDGSDGGSLSLATSVAPMDDEMLLFVDWSRNDTLVCSAASGQLATLRWREGGLAVDRTWQGHDLEAWCVCASRQDTNVVYSGGDDATFKAWDTREAGTAPATVFANRKTHAAGVTFISHASTASHLLTGSYDDTLRLWDARVPSRPIQETELGCGGGVWRVEGHPDRPSLAVVACMHAGVKVVDVQRMEEVFHYEKQRTLAYGASWGGQGPSGGSLVASCSFYDRQLHFWEWLPPEVL